MLDYEKLGAFYLGRPHDLQSKVTQPKPLLYDSKDLTTHAVCVGMTGSGKTGLCLSLLEEAALDGVPAIAIDPKGDLGNLALAFPQLRPEDFRPWIDESAATRAGQTPDQYAANTATLWREGLAKWDQDGARIGRYKDAAELSIYTPGSNAGLPLTVLKSFAAPPPELIDDSDAFRDRVAASASGLLALLGIDINPVQSREHILISNLLDRAWRAGQSLDLPELIRQIQSPPIETIGVLSLEEFYPTKARTDLAMTLNNLLASPSFARWMEGEPLSVKRLLYTPEGKPRISIISIAHLSDAERMFLVTMLLNEVLTWMRSQPGTSSLRALLYMDEVFGYFPPTANPPSKIPMLTLLKQARAYGLGIVLATQNPVDLDYKGLSNTGTWFLGRLQTERDKMRVLDGLQGAAASTGGKFDRQAMETTLAGLGSRKFLLNNVHEDGPVVFETRWAMSYLRGPLTRGQIQTLMADRRKATGSESTPTAVDADSVTDGGPPVSTSYPADASIARPTTRSVQPTVPSDVRQYYLPVVFHSEAELIYRPALLGSATVGVDRKTYQLEYKHPTVAVAAVPSEGNLPDDPWPDAGYFAPDQVAIQDQPVAGAAFAALPDAMRQAASYKKWGQALAEHMRLARPIEVWECKPLDLFSNGVESEGDFRIQVGIAATEQRDREVQRLREKHEGQVATLQKKIESAERVLQQEKSERNQGFIKTAASWLTTVVSIFNERKASKGAIASAESSAQSTSKVLQDASDVGKAQTVLEELKQEMDLLAEELEAEQLSIRQHYDVANLPFERHKVQPYKSEITIEPLAVLWTPWHTDSAGSARPAYVYKAVG